MLKVGYWMSIVPSALILAAFGLSGCSQSHNAIISDYAESVITMPPAELGLDPFYQKYADATGVSIIGSERVTDEAVLVARDIVIYMLSERPDLRHHMAENRYRVGIMAETDSTLDIPEQRHWEKPLRDDPRLTDFERENYHLIEAMTDAEYWNSRARGMGGRFTTGAEENILGYPGTRYFGENILVHEFAHGIHRAIREVDPELNEAIQQAYEEAMEKGLWQGHYTANTASEYWAEGTQWWFNSNYDWRKDEDTYILSSDDLKEYDSQLFELLSRVYSDSHRIPADVFYEHNARVHDG